MVTIMNSNEQLAIELIRALPPKKLEVALDFLQYLTLKEEWQATRELIDEDILSEIIEGKKQIDKGDYLEFEEIRKNV